MEILKSLGAENEPFWNDGSVLGRLAKDYLSMLLEGNRHGAVELIVEAADRGVNICEIYMRVFQPAQLEVGRLWQNNRISVAQEHFCSSATQMAMARLYPKIFNTQKNGRKIVAACVAGDLHEIGIRMVADILEMDGWDTYYIGASAPPRSILDYSDFVKADVLALSATMTFNLGAVKDLIGLVRASHGFTRFKVMVGGRLFNLAPELWRQIGADGYAGDALQACAEAARLVQITE